MNFIKENVCGNEVPQKSLLLPIQMDIFEEWSCEMNLTFNGLYPLPELYFAGSE